MRVLRACLGRLAACRRGVSAVEFGLIAPILALGVLVLADIGMAVSTRMELDRNVRAGAQSAMSLNNNTGAIRTIVETASGNPTGLTVQVGMTCSCGGGGGAACTALCGTGDAPSVFYDIRAARQQPGIILGERTVRSELRVQVR